MTFDFKKKHKSVKFDSKDMIESYQKENPDLKDSIPIKQKEVDPNLFKSELIPQKENEEPIEANPIIQSVFGKYINKFHAKKAKEGIIQKTSDLKGSSILKSIQKKDTNDTMKESNLKGLLMTKSQMKKNFKVKDTIIQMDWLKNKPTVYDVILLNAFYLVDIKKNLQNTKARNILLNLSNL